MLSMSYPWYKHWKFIL